MVDEYITQYYGREAGTGYDFVYSVNHTPHNDEEFRLHNHDGFYELYLFLSGNARFQIEGNLYTLHPHDILIVRPFEMHHNIFLSQDRYERIILFLDRDFFRKYQCSELEAFFLERRLGIDCQIPAAITNREMFSLLMKMNRYLSEGAEPVTRCVLIEFLYLLNRIREPLTAPTAEDPRISALLLYINEHLTEDLSLDRLSGTFFINKSHLCRIFKTITGYTINQYINHKRLLYAQELHKKGQSLLEASSNAGYNSYAHFYRMYKKEFGAGPKQPAGLSRS